MNDFTQRHATAAEVADQVGKSRQALVEIGQKLLREKPVRDLRDLVDLLDTALEGLQGVFNKSIMAGRFEPIDALSSNVYMLLAASVLQTMKHNPLYGSRALQEQLEHHFTRLANTGAAVGGVIFERKEESSK